MLTMDELLVEIDEFLRDFEVAETTFGRHAVNDGKFVGRIRGGGGVTLATVERARSYMKQERAKRSEAA